MIKYSRATRYSGLFCAACWLVLLLPWPRISEPTGVTLTVGFWIAGVAFVACFIADTAMWLMDDVGHNLDGVERPEPGGEEWPKER